MMRLSGLNTPRIAAVLVGLIAVVALHAGEPGSDGVGTSGSGPLDGLTFTGMLGPDGKPKDVADTFVFENGTFVSKECELRCKYPARPYFVRREGERILFISETQCPYKDAKITWRGTIEGDRISGRSTWSVRRWYWTWEDSFEFEGRLAVGAAAGND